MKIFTLSTLFMVSSIYASAQIVDAGFELGLASGWTQTSTNFGSPICDAVCGDCNGNCGPYAGDNYAWFGGTSVLEEGSLSQGFTIPSGTTASLSFYKKIALAADSLDTEKVDVKLDGNILYTAHCGNGEDAEYIQETFDISSYADGGFHYLDLIGFSSDGRTTNILFDNFNLAVDGTNHVGINDLLNAESEITFFPNPVVDQLMIRFNKKMTGLATVKIIDLNGKIISSSQLNNVENGTFTFDAKTLPNGIYNVVIENDNASHTERVVIAH